MWFHPIRSSPPSCLPFAVLPAETCIQADIFWLSGAISFSVIFLRWRRLVTWKWNLSAIICNSARPSWRQRCQPLPKTHHFQAAPRPGFFRSISKFLPASHPIEALPSCGFADHQLQEEINNRLANSIRRRVEISIFSPIHLRSAGYSPQSRMYQLPERGNSQIQPINRPLRTRKKKEKQISGTRRIRAQNQADIAGNGSDLLRIKGRPISCASIAAEQNEIAAYSTWPIVVSQNV